MDSFTRSLAAMVRHWARISYEAVAVTSAGVGQLTYGELHRRSSQLANALSRAGADSTSRVAFLGTDARTWALVWVAASKIGAAAVPMNWRLSHEEIAAVLADVRPVAVICEAAMLELLGLADQTDTQVVVDGVPVAEFEAWFTDQRDTDPERDGGPDCVSFLIYTSGTSGRPKGVQLSNANIAENLARPAPWHVGPDDVVFVPAPMFHVSGSGWLFLCLARGAHALYVRQIDAETVLRLFESERVTNALMVPALMQMLVRHPTAQTIDFSRLRTLIYGGSAISPTVMREALEVFGCQLVQSYGMTETCGPITFLGPEDHHDEALLSSAGRPVPGVEVAIFSPDTFEHLDVGQTGEVWTRSSLVMAGYRNMPSEQSAVVQPDGWLRTGDAGHFDENGYLYITDRVKDMIVSGGENVYPVEVENVLMSDPEIADVAVIGVPDDRWGEAVLAVVVKRGEHLDEEAVISRCRERLAHYKCPTSITVVAELPRNSTGKVLRRDLRDNYWRGHARRVG